MVTLVRCKRRTEAALPPGDCRSDPWFTHQLALRLKCGAQEIVGIGELRVNRQRPLMGRDSFVPMAPFLVHKALGIVGARGIGVEKLRFLEAGKSVG